MQKQLAQTIRSFSDGIKRSNRPEDRKLAADYLSALAPILAGAVLGDDLEILLIAFERQLGHTWLVDAEPFRDAFEKYGEFKKQVGFDYQKVVDRA